MKRGTPGHPKTMMLVAELEKVYAAHRKRSAFGGKAEAIGILECLWEWASKYAIQGDIGKWPNDAIAQGIGWRFSGNELISALIASRWVDEVSLPHRLVIHDIKDHATNCWRQNLENAGLTWWDGSSPRRWKLQKSQNNLQKKSKNTPQPEPESKPEPKPEPESSATQPDDDFIPARGALTALRTFEYQSDEDFCRWKAEYEQTGASFLDTDWTDAYTFEWKPLDWEQKLAALKGFQAQRAAGMWQDPSRVKLPKNYLHSREFNRKPVKPGPAVAFETPAERRRRETNAGLKILDGIRRSNVT
jgi:hypothetical protein